jgi:hypothetical protein
MEEMSVEMMAVEKVAVEMMTMEMVAREKLARERRELKTSRRLSSMKGLASLGNLRNPSKTSTVRSQRPGPNDACSEKPYARQAKLQRIFLVAFANNDEDGDREDDRSFLRI